MIKSKERTANFGEVFTSEHEVEAMLDLIKDEAKRIDSRFLEPACGDGNFLIAVLKRKLETVEKYYGKNQSDFERYTFLAVSSIYGIDILRDNVEECHARLFIYVSDMYASLFKNSVKEKFLSAVRFVLSKNILHGDALTLQLADNHKCPIVFSEWCFVSENKVKRTEYTFNSLIAYQPFDGNNLFSDLGKKAFTPQPLQVHSLTFFMDYSND